MHEAWLDPGLCFKLLKIFWEQVQKFEIAH